VLKEGGTLMDDRLFNFFLWDVSKSFLPFPPIKDMIKIAQQFLESNALFLYSEYQKTKDSQPIEKSEQKRIVDNSLLNLYHSSIGFKPIIDNLTTLVVAARLIGNMEAFQDWKNLENFNKEWGPIVEEIRKQKNLTPVIQCNQIWLNLEKEEHRQLKSRLTNEETNKLMNHLVTQEGELKTKINNVVATFRSSINPADTTRIRLRQAKIESDLCLTKTEPYPELIYMDPLSNNGNNSGILRFLYGDGIRKTVNYKCLFTTECKILEGSLFTDEEYIARLIEIIKETNPALKGGELTAEETANAVKEYQEVMKLSVSNDSSLYRDTLNNFFKRHPSFKILPALSYRMISLATELLVKDTKIYTKEFSRKQNEIFGYRFTVGDSEVHLLYRILIKNGKKFSPEDHGLKFVVGASKEGHFVSESLESNREESIQVEHEFSPNDMFTACITVQATLKLDLETSCFTTSVRFPNIQFSGYATPEEKIEILEAIDPPSTAMTDTH
jgi:hypothetical protein